MTDAKALILALGGTCHGVSGVVRTPVEYCTT
jgi:hypothetical protein